MDRLVSATEKRERNNNRKKGEGKMKVLVGVMMMALSVVLASTCYADNLMAMRWFSQLDSWQDDPIGSSGNTIGSHGCTITCVAMAMNYFGVSTDPRQFNQWLSGHQGYDAIGQLVWPKVSEYTGGVVYYGGNVDGVDPTRLNQELDAGYPMILKVVVQTTSGPQYHFILAVGRIGSTIYIVDPLDYPARLTTLADSYGSYSGMRLLRGPARTNLVGYWNGWDSAISLLFVDCYGYHGGRQTFGTPVARTIYSQARPAPVWEWELCLFQVFDGGDLGECAIGYDNWVNPGEAFPMHGQLWNFYKAYNGPYLSLGGVRLGGPLDCERYATNNFNGHKLVVQKMANGFLVYDTVTGFSDAMSDSSSLTIATLPHSDTSLVLMGWVLADASIRLAVNSISGAVSYPVYQDGQFIGYLTNLEMTVTGLVPQTLYHFQVEARAANNSVLAVSNILKVTGPGQAGSFVLQGTAENWNSSYIQWDDTLYDAQFYWVFRDGAMIAKVAGRALNDYPLDPGHTYHYQVAAVTASGLVLGWSNVCAVTTKQAPPPPPAEEPVPSLVQIQLEPTWLFATDGWATATVFDQFGTEMPGVRVLFFSSNPSVFVISGDNGYCIANNIGTAEVWAEVYDRRWVQSERVSVEVVAEIPPEPIYFDSSPLQLDCDFELLSNPPFIEYHTIMIRVYLSNPTDQPITFYGPRGFVFREDGSLYGCSSFSSTAKTLNPGESGFYVVSSIQLPEAGHCFVQVHTCPTRSMIDTDWQVIDQTAPEVSNTLWLNVISEDDLRAELGFLSFELATPEVYAGDPVCVQTGNINWGDIDIRQPFVLTVGIAGLDSQDFEVDGLARGGVYYHTFNLGVLPAGSYKIDAFADSTGVVSEYDESDNLESAIIEVLPLPTQPNLAITAISAEPTQPTSLDSIRLSLTIENLGQGEAGPCQLLVRCSDPMVTPVTADVSALAGGQSTILVADFPPLSPGNYGFLATVDNTRVVAESNEEDNLNGLTLTVVEPPRPDLVITNLQVSPAELRVGQTAQVSWTEVNDGTAEAAAHQTTVAFGSQSATVAVPAIPAGGSYALSQAFSLLTEGEQTVRVEVDSGNTVAEENEADNSAETLVMVLPPLLPDYQLIGSYTIPAQPLVGENLKVVVPVGNFGDTAGGAGEAALTYNNLLLVQPLPGLAVRQTTDIVFNLGSPGGAGTFTWRIYISTEFAEKDKVNNEGTITFTIVEPPRPNAVITQASYLPSPIYAGQAITISFTASNSGAAAMPAQTVGVILGQSICGTANVPALAIKQSYSGQISFNSLTTWRDVTFYVAADFTNVAKEENEADNAKALAVSFLPPPGDAWDPADNVVSGATALNNPTATEQIHGPHTLSSTDCYDWFKVYLVSGRRYNFNTVGGTGNDYGELYSNASGTVRVAFNNDSGGNLQFILIYAPSTTGWYYLRVRAYSVGSSCSYSLKYRDLGAVPSPDLAVDQTYYLFYDWGDCYFFLFKIINVGSVTAGGFRVEGEIPELGLTFSRDIPEGLARGSYRLFAFYPVYPVPPPTSTLTLKIKVDSLNQVAESNESNNSYQKVVTF